MKKILVPIDFSEDTTLVCRYALELGRHEGATICLMHAYYDRPGISESTFPGSVETETYISEHLLKDTFEQARERLGHLEDTVMKMAGDEGISKISILQHLEGGEPTYGIMGYSSSFGPDIIVMGTAGRGRKGFLEGSVSRRIMNNADIPVIAIPSMDGFKGFGNILYMTNFDPNDARSIHTLEEVLRPYDIRLHVLHLLDTVKPEEAEVKMDQLRSHFLEQEDKGHIRFNIRENTEYRNDVLNYTRDHAIDMIAFIPHKRHFLDGFFRKVMTKKDLYDAGVPLLSIPGRERENE